MSTFTLLRLYLKHQNLPRVPLPCIGFAGTLYSNPLIDQQKYFVRGEYGRVKSSPELSGTSKILVKKGAMGSFFFRRGYCTTIGDIKKAEKEHQEKNKFKLKTLGTLKVMVWSDTNKLSAMTIEEANKLAKKKSMNLVHISDSKCKPVQTKKEIYALVSKSASINSLESNVGVEALTNNSKGNAETKQKEAKTLLMKSNIGQHDIDAKIIIMKKWVKKGHRVRVIISQQNDKGNAEIVYKNIEQQMSEVSKIQQKSTKGCELRFYLSPQTNTNPNDKHT